MLLPVSTVISQDFPLMVPEIVRQSPVNTIIVNGDSDHNVTSQALPHNLGYCPFPSCPVCSHGHSCLLCPSSLHSQQIRPLEAGHCM